MVNNSVYIVERGQEFFVFFKKANLRDIFMEQYTPGRGFGILIQQKRFKVYHGGYIFFAEEMYSSENPEQLIGINITGVTKMTQTETFESAVKRMQVIGLPKEYFRTKREKGQRQPNVYEPFPRAFLDAVRDETSRNSALLTKEKTTSSDIGMEKADYLNEHEGLITEKEKFDALSLSTIKYKAFSETTQNTWDGTVYKFEIECDEEDEEHTEGIFKENTRVKVPVNDGGGALAGSVVDCDDKFVFIKFNGKKDIYMRLAAQGEIIETGNPEYKMKKQAIQTLREESSNNPYLLDLLVNSKLEPYRKKFNYKTYKITLPNGREVDNVNPSQKEAIERALSVEDFLLVQGPPGTGKTTIITEMVKMFVEQDKRVLICSKNNLAVDNVLEKCQNLFYDAAKINKMQCLRLGKEEKVILPVQKVLPRPLTMTIQNDVKERSEKSRIHYNEEEQAKQKVYENAVKDTTILFEILRIFASEREVYHNTGTTINSSFWSLLLGEKRKEQVLSGIQSVVGEIDKLMYNFWRLLLSEQLRITGNDVLAYCANIQAIAEKMGIVVQSIESAPIRFKLIFGEKGDEALLALTNFLDQKTKVMEWMNDLLTYHGNPVAQEMTEPKSYEKVNLAFINAFQEKLKQKSEECRSRLFMWKNVLDEWHDELHNDQNSFEDSLLKSVKIIGATCIGVNTNESFRDTMYDIAIVDEAGQITLHDLLVPFVKAKKIILIGDHLQLPPSQEDEFCEYLKEQNLLEFPEMETQVETKEYLSDLKEVFSISLFERLFLNEAFANNKVMLDTQFRMHPDIATFISDIFYDGKYKSGVTAEERYIDIAGFDKPMYFIDTCHSANKYEDVHADVTKHTNSYEASICGKYLADILWAIETGNYKMSGKGLVDKNGDYDIGVITAYKAQIKLIREKIIENLKGYCSEEQATEMVSRLAINTLDSFQGRDNQIIFYSFVRSNKKHSIGFLNEVRRLNVMMTRAKSLLVMIGDSETLTQCNKKTVHDDKKADYYYNELVRYCQEKKGYLDVTKLEAADEKTEKRDQ